MGQAKNLADVAVFPINYPSNIENFAAKKLLHILEIHLRHQSYLSTVP